MAEAQDDRLRLLIERVERLEEEKKGINGDIKDVYAEGKAVGYDPKMMREIVRLRKMRPDDRREMELILETYKCALGLGSSDILRRAPEPTPLEQAIAEATGKPIDMVQLAAEIHEKGGRIEQRDGASVLVLPMAAGDGNDDTDDLFARAVRIVTETRKASASFLQRQLGLGYNSAARLIEHMERTGIVGPANHVGRREVLAPAPETV